MRTSGLPENLRWNKGRPVYRVRSTAGEHYALAAFLAGIFLLILTSLWFSKQYIGFSLSTVVFAYILWRVRAAPDRCSAPACNERLGSNDRTCPQCGGSISGKIRSPRERLEIEEQRFIDSFRDATAIGSDALVELGRRYHLGHGVEPDEVRAFECFEKAAQLGNVEGMLLTADHYRNGDGVEADIDFAILWYTKAMEFDKVWAPFALGTIYGFGEDVQTDKSKALLYMQIAHENGNPEAARWIDYLSGGNE